jgi:hypothetical protein
MSRSNNSYYTAGGQLFQMATAATDAFVKEDVQYLAAAVNAHDHSTGYGKPVAPMSHVHDGVDGTPKLIQANTHQTPDTDALAGSLHHTIGTSATQAAAGNHAVSGHTGYTDTGTGAYVRAASPTLTGTVTAPTFSGALSGNATTATSATSATTAGTVTTAAQAAITSVGTLSGLTVTGLMAAGTITGQINTASQPNITTMAALTSHGTLTGLTVSGATSLTGTDASAGSTALTAHVGVSDYPFAAKGNGDVNVLWASKTGQTKVQGLAGAGTALTVIGEATGSNYALSVQNSALTNLLYISNTGVVTMPLAPAFAASDKYLVIDASGNIHKSALGPAS